MKKLLSVVMLLIVVGCEEAQQYPSIWKPVPQQWAAQYGDSEDSRQNYNLIRLAGDVEKEREKLKSRLVELEGKVITDGEMVDIEAQFLPHDPKDTYLQTDGYAITNKVDPNDPNK